MPDTIVPDTTLIAAKRGFVRTAAQALATSTPTFTITGMGLAGADLAVVAWSVGAALVSSFLAGAASYLSILSAGIPEEYQPDRATRA